MAEVSQPTPERQRRSAFLVGPATATEAGPARAGERVHRALSTLDRLSRNGAIEPRQFYAGVHLRNDWELGILGAREPASGSSSAIGWYYAEARLAALRSYQNAVDSLGPMAAYVLPVALLDASLSELAASIRRNRQEVAGVLKLGLDTLADHYRIDH